MENLRRRLLSLAVKILWNREDAEEIVQDAFALALTKGQDFQGAAFGAWMYRTVGNLCLNRRRLRRHESPADWMDPAHTATPEAAACKAEQLSRLRDAVAMLPDRQRLALVLRTMERMDYERISEIMQVSISTARSHVHWARRRLAEILGRDSEDGQ